MYTIGVIACIALAPLACCSAVTASAASAALCFEDGIPPERLANVVADGDVFPLGMAVGDWPVARLLSAVSEIIIEELLGVNVSSIISGGNSVDGFYAMAGCATPSQVTDRGCGSKTTRMHLYLEAWINLYRGEYDQIQRDFPETAPKSLGSSGYTGTQSMYLPKRILDYAINSEGVPLEFYRTYNSSWYEPSEYFDKVSAVNLSWLIPCRQTRFVQSNNMQTYVQVTQDIDGVENIGGSLMAKCQDGFFWRAPACRDNVTRCVPVLTGGTGWEIEAVMQKATLFSMPLALGVATPEGYYRIPTEVKSLFVWWVPDDTFLDLNPVEVRFPRYDRAAWLNGDLRTAPEQVAIEKLVSQNLGELAPAVEDLVQKMRWSPDDVDVMLRDMKASEDPARTVACRWLVANSETWSSWLAGETACFEGFGLFDGSGFVAERDGAAELACRPCESGTYSEELRDTKGKTHICQKCPVGTIQPSGAAARCDPCNEGEYQDEEGAVDCKRCPLGRFQDQKGKSGCKLCSNGTTTLGLGSLSEKDCGCLPGTISEVYNVSCQPCPEGLSCPVLSTLSSLLNGSAIAHELSPRVRAGYFSTAEQPLELFKCIPSTHCPGGPPNTCLGGLSALPCAACGEREYFDGQACVVCISSRQELFGLGCVAGLAGLVLAYYVFNSPMTAKASTMLTTTTALGLMVMMLQKVGVIGNMTVDFPFEVQDIFQAMQVFILDIETLGYPCVASSDAVRRYLSTVMLFPAVIVGILFCLAISKLLPKKWRWATSKTLNLMGQFLQMGYTTMSVTAMVPMTCYSHPNGLHSLLKFPEVFCGTEEHSVMLVPLWSSQGLSDRVPQQAAHGVSSFRFLLARFRLDGWWYGVPLLVRGSLLNLPVVLATDHPPIQIVSMSVILVFFMAAQALVWPWKPPLINALDCWISACVILLVVSSAMCLPDLTDDMLGFRNTFTVAVIVLLFGSVLLALGSIGFSLLLRALGFQEELMIVTLGPIPKAERVSSALRSPRMSEYGVVRGMGEQGADADVIETRVKELAVYDVTHISRCITLLAKEVLHDDDPDFDFTRRVSAKSFARMSRWSRKKVVQGNQNFVAIAPTAEAKEQEGASCADTEVESFVSPCDMEMAHEPPLGRIESGDDCGPVSGGTGTRLSL
eukprot:s1009_g16.t2